MRFVDIDTEERMAIRRTVEDKFRGYIAGYGPLGGVLIAMPNDANLCNGIHATLNNAGFYGSGNPWKYFPIGSDNPPDILRHDASYPGSRGFLKYVEFNFESN